MVSPRLENYNNVFTSDLLSFTFSDPAPDGDKIDVIFNGQIIAQDLELTGQGSTINLPALTKKWKSIASNFQECGNDIDFQPG